jgi:hypothetical protein
MGFLGRLLFATQAIVAIAALGIVFAQAGMPIINMAQDSGGPFTPVVDNLETVVPLLIGALFLFVPVWFIVSGARRERARNQQNRRPPL